MTSLNLRPQGHRVAVPAFSSIFNDLFEGEFPAFQNDQMVKSPAKVNIKETKDSYEIEVAAPGFAKENFAVKVEDTLLTISGEKKVEETKTEHKVTRQEFRYVDFKRSFTLPKLVEADKISATYENGILTVSVPKMEEAKSKGPIDVKVS